MATELLELLRTVKAECGGSNSKMALRLGIGATSVRAYFIEGVLPGFDKIPALAKLGKQPEDQVRALLTRAHEERARRRWGGSPTTDTSLSPPRMPPMPARLIRTRQYAMAGTR